MRFVVIINYKKSWHACSHEKRMYECLQSSWLWVIRTTLVCFAYIVCLLDCKVEQIWRNSLANYTHPRQNNQASWRKEKFKKWDVFPWLNTITQDIFPWKKENLGAVFLFHCEIKEVMQKTYMWMEILMQAPPGELNLILEAAV